MRKATIVQRLDNGNINVKSLEGNTTRWMADTLAWRILGNYMNAELTREKKADLCGKKIFL